MTGIIEFLIEDDKSIAYFFQCQLKFFLFYSLKVRHLEENGAVMADDLMQKSLIIQTYVMENKSGKIEIGFVLYFPCSLFYMSNFRLLQEDLNLKPVQWIPSTCPCSNFRTHIQGFGFIDQFNLDFVVDFYQHKCYFYLFIYIPSVLLLFFLHIVNFKERDTYIH